MTYWTLQYNGIELTFADRQITAGSKQWSNQSQDKVTLTIATTAADSAQPFPYDAQIIIRSGRIASAPALPSGLPVSGRSQFTGGQIRFIGWAADPKRIITPAGEFFQYSFLGIWERWLTRVKFRQLWATWNGTANVADWRDQVCLGLSVNSLIGPQNTVAGSSATNLMSIRQTLIQIVQYAIGVSNLEKGANQFAFDVLTTANDGVNWDLVASLSGTAACVVPDYVPGFAQSGKTGAMSGTGAAATATLLGAELGSVLRAPLNTVNDITCAEAINYEAKWLAAFMGSVVIYTDYDLVVVNGAGVVVTPPTLRICTRDGGPAGNALGTVNFPFPPQNSGVLAGPTGPCYVKATNARKRTDLIPAAVDLNFRITTTNNGNQQTGVLHDIAAYVGGSVVEGVGVAGALKNIGSLAGGWPGSGLSYSSGGAGAVLENMARFSGNKTATLNMEGGSSISCVINSLPISLADPAYPGSTNATALAMWQFLHKPFATVTALALYSGSSVTVLDDSGADITSHIGTGSGQFGYILQDNAIPSWLQQISTASPIIKQATIVAQMAYQEVATISGGTVQTKQTQSHEIRVHATLIMLSSSGWSSPQTITLVGASELVPLGLAGYVLRLESAPIFEGSLDIQEPECTGQIQPGNLLNFIGSNNPEWATMQALVQQIEEDWDAGATHVDYGPAKHLDAADIVAMNRANRGPRTFYLIGGNMGNSVNQGPGGQTSTNVAQRGGGRGVQQDLVNTQHFNLADSQTNASAYAGSGFPGITQDLRPSGQASYGGLGSQEVPTVNVQYGSGGSIYGLAQLVGSGALQLTNGVTNILLDVADAKSYSGNIKLVEVPICYLDGSGVSVQAYQLMLASPVYKTSGNPNSGLPA
jgi:hypothetical protein